MKILVFPLLCLSVFLQAQDTVPSMYYESYPGMLTTRLYEVTKFNSFQILQGDRSQIITYRPNTNINMGLGFTYRGLTVNFGFKIPAFNDDDDKYGTTEHFNADAGIYLKKIAGLAFFEIYNGYYYSDLNTLRPHFGQGNSLQVRGDIRFFTVGVSALYVVNNDKLSYRAAYTQDAWQKKSAGSLLLGGFATYTGTSADSNLIPNDRSQDFGDHNFSEIRSYDIGPMVGYIYTAVLKQRWFATISLSVGSGLNSLYVNEELGNRTALNFNFRANSRLALGYNGPVNYFGLSYYNEINEIHPTNLLARYNAGQFRINLVHRFNVNGLGFIDKVMDTFNWFFLPRDG